jgi:hypothetical protein
MVGDTFIELTYDEFLDLQGRALFGDLLGDATHVDTKGSLSTLIELTLGAVSGTAMSELVAYIKGRRQRSHQAHSMRVTLWERLDDGSWRTLDTYDIAPDRDGSAHEDPSAA